MPILHVHLLPTLVAEEALAGATAVVIDVLRATTTIVHALASGAEQVVPCLMIEDAQAAAAVLPEGEAVLGGERDGIKIEGFDLGNSPSEYTAETVGGRTVVFTTTNGTRAMMRCQQAREVLLAALVNRQAVVRALLESEDIHIVCAGTRGEITREDVLLAGGLVEGLAKAGSKREMNDEAGLALDAWQAARALAGGLKAALAASQGGRNLVAEGFAADIATAAQLDRFTLVPRLTWPEGVIRAS